MISPVPEMLILEVIDRLFLSNLERGGSGAQAGAVAAASAV
jgi:hypothetical protein